ncbi:MAG TPA: CBS domain-containing protein [Luteibacter sp.]|jgi:CBS domain-containing protein|nr:CBS domain-containing protein [Luteibacter sp.]
MNTPRTVVDSVMAADPRWVPSTMNLRECALIMRNENLGVMPVLDGDGHVLGLVTDRDIVVRGVAEREDLSAFRVADVMSVPVMTVRTGSELEHAVLIMRAERIRRLPVVDDANRLLGLLTLSDIQSEEHRPNAAAAGDEWLPS